MKYFASIFITVFILMVQPATATTYRCMTNGTVMFSDTPCSKNKDDIVVWESSENRKISKGRDSSGQEESDVSMHKDRSKSKVKFIDDRIKVIDGRIEVQKVIIEHLITSIKIQEESKQSLLALDRNYGKNSDTSKYVRDINSLRKKLDEAYNEIDKYEEEKRELEWKRLNL